MTSSSPSTSREGARSFTTLPNTFGFARARRSRLQLAMLVGPLATLAACATPAPPAPPPPPPPPPPPVQAVEQVPYRPLPPNGAAYVMAIPAKNALGGRDTINRELSDDEETWHFRSAWNVAALNCTAPQYEPILKAYSAFISDNAKELLAISTRLDRGYYEAAQTRREAIVAREDQMTAVYNFFALPPARARFCRAALDIANRALISPPQDAAEFARDNFAQLQEPFDLFFDEYEDYQRASSEWDAKWGERFGSNQPGWLATQRARARGVPIPSVGESDPADMLAAPGASVETVIDPETGAAVPVIPVPEDMVSQPVVEPLDRQRIADDNAGNAPQ